MTELQAALGVSQLNRLDEYVASRHLLAEEYDNQLESLPIKTPWRHPDGYSGFHLYVIRLDLEKIKLSHRDVFEALRAQGIGVNLHYIPVHTQPYYQALGFKANDFPESLRYYSEAISLPLYATMSKSDQESVVLALKEVLA
jgi:dTDP-4-amino-4,6-dideoxygalactose transaminase